VKIEPVLHDISDCHQRSDGQFLLAFDRAFQRDLAREPAEGRVVEIDRPFQFNEFLVIHSGLLPNGAGHIPRALLCARGHGLVSRR
jgi:hypothetical protein